MTEDLIKQRAEEYAKNRYDTPFENDSSINVIVSEESYIAGAHSRDEEIEQLKKLLFEKDCDIQFLEHKLRNPWISVEDRLPDKWKRLKVYQGTGEECYSWITKDVFVIKDGWETPEIAFYDYDAKIWWSEFGDNIENLFGEPTHWMSIPQIEKEEVQ